jgi:hypothetical protein
VELPRWDLPLTPLLRRSTELAAAAAAAAAATVAAAAAMAQGGRAEGVLAGKSQRLFVDAAMPARAVAVESR